MTRPTALFINVFGLAALLALAPAPAALAQDHTNTGSASYIVSSPPLPTDNPTTVNGDYHNLGRVTADGTDISAAFPPTGALHVSGRFTNSGGGTLTATGTGLTATLVGAGLTVTQDFTHSGSGAITATGAAENSGYGVGIRSEYRDFIHSGSGAITATGAGMTDGSGMGIAGVRDFIHSGSGAITATGTGDGTGGLGGWADGIFVESGFTHSGPGTVTALGVGVNGGRGTGLSSGGSGGFTQSGSGMVNFLAYGRGGGLGQGLFIGGSGTGMVSQGPITLAARTDGLAGSRAYSMKIDIGNAFFKTGSTLYLADPGANVTFTHAGNVNSQSAVIESGARLVSLAATVNSGSTTGHTNFLATADMIEDGAGNAVGANGEGGFVTAGQGVYRYVHSVTQGSPDAANYSLTVTRVADASSVTGGAAGSFLTGLENYWRGTDLFTPTAADTTRLDDADVQWLHLLSGIEHAADVKAAGEAFFRQASPQAMTQSILALNRAGQVATRQFKKELLGALPDFGWNDGLYPTYPGSAPPAGDGGGPRTTLWGSPFYHSGSQDGNRLYTDLDQDFTGFNLGVTHWGGANEWGEAAFGAAFNYVNGDYDGTGYGADSDSYGFSLGAAARFNGGGSWNPRLALYGGWMSHDLDQTRRVSGLPFGNGLYRSSPDADTWNLGLSFDNDFAINESAVFRPRLALDYASTSFDRYTERGPAGGLAMRVHSDDYDSFRSDLGASLIFQACPSVSLEARADWYHEFADTEATVVGRAVSTPGLVFATEGLDPGRDSGSVGAGLKWTPPAADNFSLALDYDFHFGANYSGHEVAGLLRVDF